MKKYFGRRAIATLLDYGLYLVLASGYMLIFGVPNNEGGSKVEGMAVVPLLVYWFVYFVGLEAVMSATPGHIVVDLKVVRLNGKRIDFVQALKRRLCDPFDLFLYGIPAAIAVKNTKYGQRLGDMWARTCIVRAGEEEYLQNPVNSC